MTDIEAAIAARRAQLADPVQSRIDARRAQLSTSLTPEQIERLSAAKAGTLEISPERAAEQKAFDRAHMSDQLGLRGGIMDTVNRNLLQTMTFGFGDEILAGVNSVMPGQTYDASLDAERARLASDMENRPKLAIGSQVAGAVLNPANKFLPAVTSVKGAAAVGAGIGAADAFGRGEGGLADRAKDALGGAALGGLFGAGAKVAIDGISAGLRGMFNRVEKRPTIEALKAVKNAAYKAVDTSGETFSADEMRGLYAAAQKLADDGNFVREADPQTFGALRTLANYGDDAGKEVSLTQLDKIRQSLWARYNRGDEPLVLDMIGAIDDLVASRADSSALMTAARAANSKYAKAELLDKAFRKARLETAASGSGGNILNKYRQAVTHILTNPKEAKWFGPEEIAVMERFVMGTDAENILRRVGKLAPGGNGLMLALNVYGAALDPKLLAVTGVGTAAKLAADKSAMRGSETILDAVSTGNIPATISRDGRAAGVIGGALAPIAIERFSPR